MFICLSFLLVNCSDDDQSASPNEEDQTPLVDRITLNVEDISIPENTYNPGNYSVWFSLMGNKMIYANPSNTAQNQFMTSFHLSNNYFTNLQTHNEVCACGYSSKFVNDGVNLYYIANEAWKYNITNNTWTELNYPATAHENNGETGILYHNDKIYFLGGRDASTKFKYFDTTTNSWSNLSNYTYSVETPDMAAINNRIYVLGGESSGKRFSYYEEGAGWIPLPDLAFNPKNSYNEHTVTSYGNRFIFALVNGAIHIYDSQEEIWAEEPITISVSGNYMNLFSDNNYLYLAYKTNLNEFKLSKITLTIP